MTVPVHKRIKRSIRFALIRLAIRALSLVPALRLGALAGRLAYRFAGNRWYDAELDRYVESADPRLLREVIARGKGMVFVTGHVGNGELLARRIAGAGVPNAACSAALEPAIRRYPDEWSGGCERWKARPEDV